jgi:hypothetical protein
MVLVEDEEVVSKWDAAGGGWGESSAIQW